MQESMRHAMRVIEKYNRSEEDRWRDVFRSIGFGRVIQLARTYWTELLGDATRSNMEPDLPRTFPAILQHLREARRFSLGDVAERSGLSKTQIWSLERGESEPKVSTFIAICAALEVDPAQVMSAMTVTQ